MDISPRKIYKKPVTHEKMLDTIHHQRNVKQNHRVPLQNHRKISVGKNVEKLAPLCTAGGM